MFQYLTSECSRHYLWDNLLCWFGGYLVIEKLYKKTHYVSFFTTCIWIFQGFTSEQGKLFVLANLQCLLGVHLVIYNFFKNTNCVNYCTNINLGCINIWPVIKVNMMCEIIYCVDLGYTWSLKNYLIRHNVFTI